jgi:hypothetical protein
LKYIFIHKNNKKLRYYFFGGRGPSVMLLFSLFLRVVLEMKPAKSERSLYIYFSIF